jgi:hypothetical protein
MRLAHIDAMAHAAWRSGASVAAAVLLLSGCSGAMASPVSTAERFEAAVGAGDYAAACELLTPESVNEVEGGSGQPCPDALETLEVPAATEVTHVEAWGRAAIVELDGDTLFLARTGESWAVRAAGCSEVPNGPYDCIVEGG